MQLSQIFNPRTLEPVAAPKIAGKSIAAVVTFLLPYFFAAAGSLLLIYLIWGGVKLMLSQGDPKAIESGKNIVTSALIGFLIIFASYWITQIVLIILGIGAGKSPF